MTKLSSVIGSVVFKRKLSSLTSKCELSGTLCGRYLERSRIRTRPCSSAANTETPSKPSPDATKIYCDDQQTKDIVVQDMLVFNDFITADEEDVLLKELEPHLQRSRYELSHWDDAIHGYREIERNRWSRANQQVLQRVRDLAFPPGQPQLSHVHVLDLRKDGHIKPHIDSVRFCGSVIAGLSLLSSAVMRLVCDADKSKHADVLLRQRSLYIMRDRARYEYTHEVLPDETSFFSGEAVLRDRRISVICRAEPT